MNLTRDDIEVGTNTKFWKAVMEQLNEWLNDIKEEALDPDGKNDLAVFKRLGGNAQSIKRMMMLPEIFLDLIEYEREKGN
jgi:hypothetical protein